MNGEYGRKGMVRCEDLGRMLRCPLEMPHTWNSGYNRKGRDRCCCTSNACALAARAWGLHPG